MLIAGFMDYRDAGKRLAEILGCPFRLVDVHIFPDGEHKLTLPMPLDEHLLVCRSLFEPNSKLIDLLLLAKTARNQGVQRLSLVAPYLCYMRQDKAFHAGEAVSQQIIGGFLADLFDDVITVDPHLHRVHSLQQAVPAKQAIALAAAKPIAAYLKHCDLGNAMLFGPDEESEAWVADIAGLSDNSYAVARKTRLGDREVQIQLPELDAETEVVLVDDVASTGETLAQAATALMRAGCRVKACVVTHALLTGDAQARMEQAGIPQIISCDSIPHPTNRIPLAPLLADGVRQALEAPPC